MNEYLKQILIILTAAAFVLSCLWSYYAFDFEPVIAMIVSATVIIGLLLEGKNSKSEQNTPSHQTSSENIESVIKEFVEKLNERYQKRYGGKFYRNFKLTLEVCENWGIPNPQKIKYENNADIGEASDVIYKTFKDKDRLLIVGKPGVGKTGLLLNLAIRLLDETDLAEKEPFPVIFNLATWSEKYANFEDWLIDALNSGEGFSKDLAEKLLDEERIILLLDGLDELARNEKKIEPAEIRKKCFDSINRYIQFDKNAVVCCREEEFTEVIKKDENENFREWASAEVLKLDEWQLEQELLKAQQSKKHKLAADYLTGQIKKNASLLQTLRTPFYLTTALEVFSEKTFHRKELEKDEKALTVLLRENFVEINLNNTKNLHDFDKNKTIKWLKWLAGILEKKDAVAFELAYLQPDIITKNWLYILITSVFAALMCSYPIGFIFGFFYSTKYGVMIALGIFLIMICYVNVFAHFNITKLKKLIFKPYGTQDIVEFSITGLWKREYLQTSILMIGFSLFSSVYFDVITGLLFFIFYIPIFTLKAIKKLSKFSHLEKPYQRFYGNLYYDLITNTALLFFAIIILIFFSQLIGNEALLFVTLLGTFIPLINLLSMPIMDHFYLRIVLYFEDKIPIKYATFLDYCAALRILEKDGGFWRFRHQNLQEYFARLEIKE